MQSRCRTTAFQQAETSPRTPTEDGTQREEASLRDRTQRCSALVSTPYHTSSCRFIWIKLTPPCRADRVTEPAEHNALPECSAMVTDQPFVPHSAAVIITMATLSHVARQQSEMHPPGVSSRAVLSAPGLKRASLSLQQNTAAQVGLVY